MSSETSIADIQQTLNRIAAEELDWVDGIPSGAFSTELDSVQQLSLIVAIEDTFKICFDPEDEEVIDNLESLCLCIKRIKDAQQ